MRDARCDIERPYSEGSLPEVAFGGVFQRDASELR